MHACSTAKQVGRVAALAMRSDAQLVWRLRSRLKALKAGRLLMCCMRWLAPCLPTPPALFAATCPKPDLLAGTEAEPWDLLLAWHARLLALLSLSTCFEARCLLPAVIASS